MIIGITTESIDMAAIPPSSSTATNVPLIKSTKEDIELNQIKTFYCQWFLYFR